MNIELSTANLRKSCRICLHEGDVDLWTHKVKLPASGLKQQFEFVADTTVSEMTAGPTPEDEISAHDILFEMFERTEYALDEIAAELPLICYRCLAELVPCYRFYRRVRHANAYVRSLYREALKIETELGGEEQVEFLDEYNDDVKPDLVEEEIKLEQPQSEQQEVEQEEQQICVETVIISDEVHCTEINVTETKIVNEDVEEFQEVTTLSEDATALKPMAQKRRIIKNPKFILTGGVTKILTNFNKSSSTVESQKSTAETHNSQPQKRQRTQREPPLENASLVVTQFIPSSLQLNASDLFGTTPTTAMEQSGDGSRLVHGDGDIHAPPPTSELRTMDYAAVEIMGAHVCDITEEDNIPLPPAAAAKFTSTMPHDGVGDEPAAIATAQRLVYVCQYCPQAFSASHYLITHVRKSHVCKYCTQAFNKNTDLYEHVKQAHRQHKCAICSKILSSHSNLCSHIKRMHGIQLPAQVALLDYRLPATEAVTTAVESGE